ncbi:MAG: hypothetical protein V3S61_02140 [Dehalococcoidales bacterium]
MAVDLSYESLVVQVIGGNYKEASTALVEAYKDKTTVSVPLVNEIEDELRSIHAKRISVGLFSKSRKEMAGEAVADTVEWLQRKLGIEREKDTLNWRLGDV